jgi:hypothetical protein
MLKAISCKAADKLEPAADPCWLWKGTHHAKLVNGFTFTMPEAVFVVICCFGESEMPRKQ